MNRYKRDGETECHQVGRNDVSRVSPCPSNDGEGLNGRGLVGESLSDWGKSQNLRHGKELGQRLSVCTQCNRLPRRRCWDSNLLPPSKGSFRHPSYIRSDVGNVTIVPGSR